MPLFENESNCETLLMKMTLICMKMNLWAEVIFISIISHLYWLVLYGGKTQLRNGQLIPSEKKTVFANRENQLRQNTKKVIHKSNFRKQFLCLSVSMGYFRCMANSFMAFALKWINISGCIRINIDTKFALIILIQFPARASFPRGSAEIEEVTFLYALLGWEH